MSTKRKRSTGSLFATPALEASTTTPLFSPPPIVLPNFFLQSKTYEQQSSPFVLKHHHSEPTHQDNNTSQTLNSRTRKRYRDARPEESQIHGKYLLCYQSTVEKLFSAQKAYPHASPQPSQQSPPQPQYPRQFPQQEAPQRSTLHSFWHLPQASQIQQYNTSPRVPQQEIVECDGCDGRIVPESPYGIDTLDADTRCTACERHVCDTCSITADTRLCLDCAMQA
ncbi:hypothetical protein E4T44_03134 [Aureobasidium sp. EXF-8845]|nr:hypothetical protein E4T44_03134 [Aureobasidium sp. EXF-8845]KAI4855446.1 hypothetical protein E4T45_03116 [Aureobasidium sp. EXF-8846]